MNALTKRIVSCLACVALIIFCIWGSTYVAKHEGHQYDGSAEGFAGTISVSVYVEGDTITDITYQTEGETPSIGGSAIQALRKKILKTQNTQIDVVSGATYSSKGFLTAVDAALAEAGVVADGSHIIILRSGILKRLHAQRDLMVLTVEVDNLRLDLLSDSQNI